MAELDPLDSPEEHSIERDAVSEEPAEADSKASRDLDELRDLLVGQERSEIVDLRKRFEGLEVLPEDVSRHLPQAILLRTRQDDQLSQALTPTIESAIQDSVKRNPGVLVDAISPVMGPAIRKSIREALASMVESINRSVEHSLTPQGIRWRMEARRTGKSFAEIVLKHSLVYRVSEVFLIHRESALLLQHVAAADVGSNDPDMISSMLGAIQDFVSDSFSEEDGGGIAQVDFGERVLLVARSETAILCCVVRGISTIDLKQKLEQALEKIGAELGRELREFQGDDSPFLMARTHMEQLLLEQRVEERGKEGKKHNVLVRSWVVALLIMGLFVWILSAVIDERNARATWATVQSTLDETPGVVLTRAERNGDEYLLSGLKDPNATDPLELARAAGLESDEVEVHFEPYLSLEDEMVVARARQRLQAPDSIELSLSNGILSLSGSASHPFIESLESKLNQVAGLSGFDAGDLEDLDLGAMTVLARSIESKALSFAQNDMQVTEGTENFNSVAQLLGDLDQLAAESGIPARVTVLGRNTPDEDDPSKLRLSRARAAIDSLLIFGPALEFSPGEDTSKAAAEASFRCTLGEL